METAMEPGSSKRYKNFYSALQLAMRNVASKWTYDDFKDCFPTYCEEFPENSRNLHIQLSEKVFESTKQRTDALLTENDAAEATDILHDVVLDAQRADSSSDRGDIWTGNLEPRAAVLARTVPTLERERDRLRAEIVKNAYENEQLIARLEHNEQDKVKLEALTTERLDNLDEMVTKFESLPLEQMEQWAMDAEEALGPRS